MPDRLHFRVVHTRGMLRKSAAEAIQQLRKIDGVVCTGSAAVEPQPETWVERVCRVVLPTAEPSVEIGKASGGVPSVSLEELGSGDTDFIFDVSESAPVSLPGPTPRFGIWRLHYGQSRLPALAEMASGTPHIRITLELDGLGGSVIEEAVVNTEFTSYGSSLDLVLAAGRDLPARAAQRLLLTGKLKLMEVRRPGQGARISDLLELLLRQARAWTRRQLNAIFRSEMWSVGVVRAPIWSFLEPGFQPKIEWMPRLGTKRFLADPFPVVSGSDITVYMEEFDYDRYQGYIVDQPLRPAPEPVSPRVVIDDGVHMSYPFPVWHDGSLYLVPESHQRGDVAIYAAESGVWKRAATLLEGVSLLDPTLFRHEGLWWLLCSSQNDLPECKLYIWHAEELFGPWQPHALNPVKCDVRCCRPGGTPFMYGGVLYRPAQDSTHGYGSALTINRVLRLSKTEFEEEPVAHINSFQPYGDGIHTLAGAGGITLLDGKKFVMTPGMIVRRLRHKFKRLLGVAT